MQHLLPRATRIVCSTSLCRVLLLAAATVLLPPAVPAQADLGPKPGMTFTFEYQIPKTAIVRAEMLECQDADCETSAPLRQVGPQGLRCNDYDCSSTAYGYAPYHKLVMTFSDDKTRVSNVFSSKAFSANFKVTVKEATLEVKEVFGLNNLCRCFPSLALTLAVETLIAGVGVVAFGLPRAVLGVVPVASLFSLPVVWYVFPQLALPATLTLGLAELFAVVFETGFVYAFTHWSMPFRNVLALSGLMNGVSFAIGLLAVWGGLL
jgi:hypothetical protein